MSCASNPPTVVFPPQDWPFEATLYRHDPLSAAQRQPFGLVHLALQSVRTGFCRLASVVAANAFWYVAASTHPSAPAAPPLVPATHWHCPPHALWLRPVQPLPVVQQYLWLLNPQRPLAFPGSCASSGLQALAWHVPGQASPVMANADGLGVMDGEGLAPMPPVHAKLPSASFFVAKSGQSMQLFAQSEYLVIGRMMHGDPARSGVNAHVFCPVELSTDEPAGQALHFVLGSVSLHGCPSFSIVPAVEPFWSIQYESPSAFFLLP